MTAKHISPPTEESRVLLDTLKTAVKEELEKKRRLGQYAVVWKNGKPVRVEADSAVISKQ